MANPAADQFNMMMVQAKKDQENEAREEIVHPLAVAALDDFDTQVLEMLEGLSEQQAHFLQCSVGILLENTGLSTESEIVLRLMYFSMLYGYYLGREGKLPEE